MQNKKRFIQCLSKWSRRIPRRVVYHTLIVFNQVSNMCNHMLHYWRTDDIHQILHLRKTDASFRTQCEGKKYPPHKLLRSIVKVPAGERVCCPRCGPHSTKGSASLISYPLVHVTVIWASSLNSHFFWSSKVVIIQTISDDAEHIDYSAWNIISTLFCILRNSGRKKLTSFHVFPCANRGYNGAFGFVKATVFDTATSFGC